MKLRTGPGAVGWLRWFAHPLGGVCSTLLSLPTPFFCFPHSSAGKESSWNAGDPGSIPGSERSAREGISYPLQYSWASLVAQLVKNPPAIRETWIWALGWEDPLRRESLPTLVFWPGEFHGLYSPWGHKESDTTEWLHFLFPFLCSLLLRAVGFLVLLYLAVHSLGFPCGSDHKESACNVRDPGLIPGLSGRSPGERNGNPLQYSCLENPMDRGAYWATVHAPTANARSGFLSLITSLYSVAPGDFFVRCKHWSEGSQGPSPGLSQDQTCSAFSPSWGMTHFYHPVMLCRNDSSV